MNPRVHSDPLRASLWCIAFLLLTTVLGQFARSKESRSSPLAWSPPVAERSSSASASTIPKHSGRFRAAAPNPVPTPVSKTASQKRRAPGL